MGAVGNPESSEGISPLDVLACNVSLPDIEVEDLIGVFKSGAYARAASPLGFLSHTSPPEVLVSDGEAHLVRRRGNQLPPAKRVV